MFNLISNSSRSLSCNYANWERKSGYFPASNCSAKAGAADYIALAGFILNENEGTLLHKWLQLFRGEVVGSFDLNFIFEAIADMFDDLSGVEALWVFSVNHKHMPTNRKTPI